MPTPTPSSSLDLAGALAIARAELARQKADADFVILDDRTVTRPFGWVFAYTTRAHRDTGDLRHAIPGNGPLVVEAATGRVTHLSTSGPPARVIAEFERQWRARQAAP